MERVLCKLNSMSGVHNQVKSKQIMRQPALWLEDHQVENMANEGQEGGV